MAAPGRDTDADAEGDPDTDADEDPDGDEEVLALGDAEPVVAVPDTDAEVPAAAPAGPCRPPWSVPDTRFATSATAAPTATTPVAA